MLTGKKILIRADASLLIGTGHVMRCLTLADQLKKRGAECYFATRLHDGHLQDKILERGHLCLPLKKPHDRKAKTASYADWLGCTQLQDAHEVLSLLNDLNIDLCVVDHYGLASDWESYLKEKVGKIIVIDDLANRIHQCDILIDQNAGRTIEDYKALAPESCRFLLGAEYALLRDEFSALRDSSLNRKKNNELKSITISMGGIDAANATEDVLKALRKSKLPDSCCINVVVGSNFPWMDEINKSIENYPWKTTLLIDTREMGKILSETDLAIGAAGSSAWERCALGVPSVMIVVAENQKVIAESLEKLNAAWIINSQQDILALLPEYISNFVNDAELLSTMSSNSSLVTDGQGAARIAYLMENLI
ncbi:MULTISPECIES: UDP-2,4-diacetamido-2,4,6-trideoxy-beta-L-altropyranose hydrolase [Pantoea]|uniref:UDP-2,4-diacetamido-2,4, 6-trideoxy-beta-L-altropyranose hydrolase n=1 Tax=Pantoea TaxID=53335 RepID=UPI0024B71455|nr:MULTISPECIES: UDP-2,4-diacetamido-2,4,6-trideoxy-beta-L-altropyranose hydrolase [Pantoea]MDJ0022481.1 UDP-2,4-diacetamido-2,4,6-trideoxy-beta-L-altropyranose hydrolase [Pantoea eucrina]